ncbi:MAG: hypothetical protein VB980_07145 [Opitutales bacterium]
MRKMLLSMIAGLIFGICSGVCAAEKVTVAGYEFSSPAGWKASEPSSKMRAAQFSAGEAEVVFFYFGPTGGGGVKANVDRWMAQFQNAKNQKTESKVTGGVKVTYARTTGTFMSGRPFGPKTPKEGYALLGAIIEGKQGAIFVKMTGPQAAVQANTAKMTAMVEAALK